MKSTELRQLIRESINEYIRDIDEAGNVAALEAKMGKTKEAIELREKKMNMDGLDEAYHDMLDKGKMKELASEVKALKKSLTKYEKQLEKLKNKGAKAEKEEEKEVIDETPEMEVKMNEADPEAGPQLEELDEARFKKGTDVGKKGKGFAKIAKSAAEKYGSEEAGKKVAGAILKKVLKKEEKEPVNESFLKMQKLAGLIK